MERYLICENPRCRFVLDLGELRLNGAVPPRLKPLLSKCPDCGRPWSGKCPFCVQPLEVAWHSDLPHCSHCRGKLQAQPAASDSRGGTRIKEAAMRAAGV